MHSRDERITAKKSIREGCSFCLRSIHRQRGAAHDAAQGRVKGFVRAAHHLGGERLGQIDTAVKGAGKNLTFKTGGVDGCDCEKTLKLIAEGKLDTEPLITHTYPLSKIDEAYELFENKRDGVIKVAVEC